MKGVVDELLLKTEVAKESTKLKTIQKDLELADLNRVKNLKVIAMDSRFRLSEVSTINWVLLGISILLFVATFGLCIWQRRRTRVRPGDSSRNNIAPGLGGNHIVPGQ